MNKITNAHLSTSDPDRRPDTSYDDLKEKIRKESWYDIIRQLVKTYPNDQELGEIVRKLVSN